MTKITSTEFQQRVGYYFGLAEKGEVIEIKRQKPVQTFIIQIKKPTKVVTQSRFKAFMEDVEKNKFISKKYKSGLDLQNTVRD